ncbi:hypothetical protein F511_11020 [Dorcoceras hygrometricum]|uniref:Reverse transcriptase Ty1/copia-type domain-containing protein n=1 Tax=Dorcoceras hygrometricum TaxID=472368 RepID=A0A2Z7CWM1_9LAMI|nr:hypothetical protein F511_11020 [Dorcoceras hygrometricum]
MRDYKTGEGLSEEDKEAELVTFTVPGTILFEDAVKSDKWRKNRSNKKNGTSEMMAYLREQRKLELKWVYKTKPNEKGELVKYKARLVAKGYSREHEVDSTKVFEPVAHIETIRLVIALAAQTTSTTN